MQINKLRDFDYTNDRLIVADMDKRDTSYIFLMQKTINELVEGHNNERRLRKDLERELGKKITNAEKVAAKEIKEGGQDDKPEKPVEVGVVVNIKKKTN